MNPRRVNLALRTLALLMTAAAAAVIVVALRWSPADEGDEAVVVTRPASRPALATAATPDLQQIWNRRLRPPLTPSPEGDVPVASANPVAGPAGDAAAPATAVVLVGTIGDSIALIRDAAGAVEARGIGEAVPGVGTVVAVRPSEVELDAGGRRLTLRRLADPPNAGSISPATDPPDESQLGMTGDGN